MDELERELKLLVIESLGLEDIQAEEIDSQLPLFGEGDGLGLDSIDALELGIALQQQYQIKVDAEDEATREHFSSIARLAQFVRSQR